MTANKGIAVDGGRLARLLFLALFASVAPAFAFAQADEVRSEDEIPEDMPAPPEDAPLAVQV